MANLIPPAARKQVTREYWVRVVSLWAVLIGTACLMVASLQLPAYILIKEQLNVFTEWYQEVTDNNNSFASSVETIHRTNEISRFLTDENENQEFSVVIDELHKIATNEIFIETIVIERTEGIISQVTITGDALTRSALADFRLSIENSEYFETAALPLSNLAKDIDIPFTISITLPNSETEPI